MSDKGRIVGGHGTHNRPWIVDDYDNDGTINTNRRRPATGSSSAAAVVAAAAGGLSHSNHSASSSRRRGSGTASSSTSNNNVHSLAAVPSLSSSQHRTTPLQLPSHHHSSADSVASGATESSYERYLVQRRAEAAKASAAASSGTTTNSTTNSRHRQPNLPHSHRVVVPRETGTTAAAAAPPLYRSNSLTQQLTATTNSSTGHRHNHPSMPAPSQLRQRSSSDYDASGRNSSSRQQQQQQQHRSNNPYTASGASGLSSTGGGHHTSDPYQEYMRHAAETAAALTRATTAVATDSDKTSTTARKSSSRSSSSSGDRSSKHADSLEKRDSRRNLVSSTAATDGTATAAATAAPATTPSERIHHHRRHLSATTTSTAAAVVEDYSSSSRDLRAKRLAQQRHDALLQQQSTDRITSARGYDEDTNAAATTVVPLHFQAHDAAVEQYLMRSRLADPSAGRSSRTSRNNSNTTSDVPKSDSHQPRPSPVVSRPQSDAGSTDARLQRTTGSAVLPPSAAISSSAKPHKSSGTKKRSGPVVVPVINDESLYNDRKGNSATGATASTVAAASTGWSTLPRASASGHSTMTTQAVAQHEAYKADTAAAASLTTDVISSGCSKVDQYLAQRQALKQRASSFTRLGKKKLDAAAAPAAVVVSTESMATFTVPSIPSAPVSFEESSADESSDSELAHPIEEANADDNDGCSDDEIDASEWSVKVCVVSAVDFPASVVPNLPFSPLLKVGLIPLERTDVNPQGEDVTTSRSVDDARCRELASLIERNGIVSLSKSRVRCTNSKILSKRDNGSAEFHEEMRWDGVKRPEKLALAVELSSRAVLTPANIRESPPQQFVGPFQLPSSSQHGTSRGQTASRTGNHVNSNDSGTGGLSSLFRKIRKSDSAEMEEANAAAAVAKLLVQGDDTEPSHHDGSKQPGALSGNHQSEIKVTLRRRKRRRLAKMTDEFRLGAKVIPLSRLPLANAARGNETIRIEQWFELDTAMNTVTTSLVGTSPSSSTATRNPSILLEISLSAPERLDDSEDDMGELDGKVESRASYSKRASIKIRNQLKQEVVQQVEKVEEPVLEPGIIDFICVVGARDIGDQKSDDGSSGWVSSTPDCCILEQFPSNDEFHATNGRTAVLPGKVEWFCFPEGCRLWRGLTPPNHDELNLKRFSASSPAQFATSIASFDACLGCTTSFCWFSISSNSDQYGSESKKTYGAVIRFYIPAPVGVDPTQDDFAQTATGTTVDPKARQRRRLWVPIGICMTSSMPIVGTMEAMLLRLCEGLAATGVLSLASPQQSKAIQEAVVSVIVSFQRPIPGIVNCSFPFLDGERLHLALPSRSGLPALPHGGAVASVCRLLGADGLNYLLAAFLTECKILLHSDEVANLSLVSEVMTALLYPFQWALPYVPVLPAEMMEFIEAPVSFLLGVPTCNMHHVDPSILEDIVVVDLDRDFSSSEYFEGRRNGHKTKMPVPLPAAVASNISKAVYRLIRAEEEIEDSYGTTYVPGSKPFPRMEPESLPEREFRLAVAIEVCGLIRGFDECLVFSSSQPVFNVDKFLQVAPSIFEDQRGIASSAHAHSGQTGTRSLISPRSRRFVSLLVCCQHFHQFLDVLESESLAFFRLIMRALQANYAKRDTSLSGMLLSLDSNDTVADLCKTLQSVEDKTPTYRVKSYGSQWPAIHEGSEEMEVAAESLFPVDLIHQIQVDNNWSKMDVAGAAGTKTVSVEYLVELQKNPWRYQKLFNLDDTSPSGVLSFLAIEKVTIREAIGDRRYRAWKSGYFKFDSDETSVISEESKGRPTTLDLMNLIGTVPDDTNLSAEEVGLDESKATAVKFSDLLRLSFASADAAGKTVAPLSDEYLMATEDALQRESAQTFFLAVLRMRNENNSMKNGDSTGRRRSLQSGGAKLDSGAFDVIIRLSFAMLDACHRDKNHESAYTLLKLSAGLYAAIVEGESDVNVVYLTERIGLHPIYADLKLWDMVYASHAATRQQNHSDKDSRDGDRSVENNAEYEAVVATLYEMNGYGIPAEELARFASRMCFTNDWFHSEKGQSLLMLAKRVCIRRDHGPVAATSTKMSDVELISASRARISIPQTIPFLTNREDDAPTWIELGWCHPIAQSSRRAATNDTARRANKTQPVKSEVQMPSISNDNMKYMRRSAVTCLAYLGSSVVVTGGLDGGVFLARKVPSSEKAEGAADNGEQCEMRGVHLDWGSSGSRYSVGSASTSLDGEYGVGAVTCLAATRSSTLNAKRTLKDVADALSDEDVLDAMDGSRVVAGTTCGDLRVWSVKDVYSAVFYANRGGIASSSGENPSQRNAGGTTSSFVNRSTAGTDFAAGSSLTRLKFSLRGRALSGHRGGVSCIDVHSNAYRPDSIVSGGADGLIKLWSLKTPGVVGGRKSPVDLAPSGSPTSSTQNAQSTVASNVRGGDALSILSGHGGRVLCVKTAWHGDRLLSGGADRTVRMWDLAGSGGRCLSSLSGHFGWVTSVHYWGPNTIISASTDRSIALWDVRVSNSPLFVLRHHHAPVSDVLLGPRSNPVMISAAVDGSIAAWDFRQLTSTKPENGISQAKGQVRTPRIARSPAGKLYTHKFNRTLHSIGPVHLCEGLRRERKTALCLGSDAIVREWDYQSGCIVSEQATGHCDTISRFVAVGRDTVFSSQLDSAGMEAPTATISASWDGTVRMRSMVPQKR